MVWNKNKNKKIVATINGAKSMSMWPQQIWCDIVQTSVGYTLWSRVGCGQRILKEERKIFSSTYLSVIELCIFSYLGMEILQPHKISSFTKFDITMKINLCLIKDLSNL
jgi:hypothetical protein